MAGSFMRDGREPFLSADIMKGNSSEFAAAMASYIGYCGRYTCADDRIVTHLDRGIFLKGTGSV